MRGYLEEMWPLVLLGALLLLQWLAAAVAGMGRRGRAAAAEALAAAEARAEAVAAARAEARAGAEAAARERARERAAAARAGAGTLAGADVPGHAYVPLVLPEEQEERRPSAQAPAIGARLPRGAARGGQWTPRGVRWGIVASTVLGPPAGERLITQSRAGERPSSRA